MKITLDELSASPRPYDFEVGPQWWRERGPGAASGALAVSASFEVALQAHRLAEDVYLEGTLRGGLDVQCGRCLARYRHALAETFQLVLEPAGDRVPADPEGAAALARDGMCLGEELGAGWFRGSEIDLGALVAEVIALSLPMQPLCREDCAGLCPTCGADRNRSRCGCGDSAPESPFAVLAALRDERREGES